MCDRDGLYDKMGLQLKALKARLAVDFCHLKVAYGPPAAVMAMLTPSTLEAGLQGLQLKAHFVVQSISVVHLEREK